MSLGNLTGVNPSNAPEALGAPPDQHQHSRPVTELVPRVGTALLMGAVVHIEGADSAGVREWLNWYKIPSYQKCHSGAISTFVRPVLLEVGITFMYRAASPVPWKGSGCQQGPRGSGDRAESLSEVPGWLFCSVDPAQLEQVLSVAHSRVSSGCCGAGWELMS